MKKVRIGNQRRPYAQWHQQSDLKAHTELKCPSCGAVMYVGPKPNFRAVSCPGCKRVWEIPRG